MSRRPPRDPETPPPFRGDEHDTVETEAPLARAGYQPARGKLGSRLPGWLAVLAGLIAAILFSWFVATLGGDGDETSAEVPGATTVLRTGPTEQPKPTAAKRGKVTVILEPSRSRGDDSSFVIFNGRRIRTDQLPSSASGISGAAGTAGSILGGLSGSATDGTVVFNGRRIPISSLPAAQTGGSGGIGSGLLGSGLRGAGLPGSGTGTSGTAAGGVGTSASGSGSAGGAGAGASGGSAGGTGSAGNGTGGVGGGLVGSGSNDGTVVFNGTRIPASEVPTLPPRPGTATAATSTTPTSGAVTPTAPATPTPGGLSGKTVVYNGVRIPVEQLPPMPTMVIPGSSAAPAGTATTPGSAATAPATVAGGVSSLTDPPSATVAGAPGSPAPGNAVTPSTCCGTACCPAPPR